MRQKNLLPILITLALMAIFPLCATAQVYVDAPIGVQQPDTAAPPATTAAGPPATNYTDQFNWGLINYGFSENVYYQYTGNSLFSGGKSPSSFLNIGYMNIIPLDFKYLPGLGIGGDFMTFSLTSEQVYSGDQKTVTGPSIDMSLYNTNFRLRLYFMDPFEELLHPFFGISWGLIFGDFKTTKVGGDKYTTYYTGITVSRNIGVEIRLGRRAGLVTEFRTVTANSVSTNNDPFNQGSDGSVNLDFSGFTVALTGYYRF